MNQMSYTGPDAEIQKEMEKRIEALARIADIAKQDNPIDILFEQFLDLLIDMIGVESGVVKLLEPRGNYFLKPEVFHGVTAKFLEKMTNSTPGGCLCSIALAKKSMAITSDITRDRSISCSHCKNEGFKFLACIPIFCHGKAVGIIQLASHKIRKAKPSETALMECAGKIFSYAMEYYDMNLSSSRCRRYNDVYLQTAKEPIIVVDKDLLIRNIGNYAVKLLDIPAESLINTPLSDIMPDGKSKEIPSIANDPSHAISAVLKGRAKQTAVAVKAHPVRDIINNEIIRYVIEMECTEKEKTIQDEYDEYRKRTNDFIEVVASIDTKNNVQKFCDSTMYKLSGFLPIQPSKYIVYFYDNMREELQLVAQQGHSQSFLRENSIIKTEEHYDYKTVLTSREVRSASDEKGGWKVIVPLTYSEEAKGILIFNSDHDVQKSVATNQAFITVGTLIADIMEKQALYDSLSSASADMAEISGKAEAVAKTIATKYKTVGEEIERLCGTILTVTGGTKVEISLRSPENALYTYSKGSQLKRTKSNISPASRESFVLERGESLYYPDRMGRETNFDGDDKLKGKFVAVVPAISKNLIIAAVRIESPNPFKDVPESIIGIIVNTISDTIRNKKLSDEFNKISDENAMNAEEVKRTKKELDQETANRLALEEKTSEMTKKIKSLKETEANLKKELDETKQNLSEEISERTILQKKERELLKKIREDGENEERQKNVIAEKQRVIVEERKASDELRQQLAKERQTGIEERGRHEEEIKNVIQELKAEREKAKEFKERLQETEEEKQEIIDGAELKLEAYKQRIEEEKQEIIRKAQKAIRDLKERLQAADDDKKSLLDSHSKHIESLNKEKEAMIQELKKSAAAADDEKLRAKDADKNAAEIMAKAQKAIEERDKSNAEMIAKAQKAIEEREKNAAILMKLLAARTKAMIEASSSGAIVTLLNKTGSQICKDYANIEPTDTNSFKQALADTRERISGTLKKYVWESLSDTALKRISEIAAARKLTAMLAAHK